MKKHLLLIGFSCTGKTSLGRKAFGSEQIIDSDRELRRWLWTKKKKKYCHVYEIFMDGDISDRIKLHEDANDLIIEGEQALIKNWTHDKQHKIISLGPGFPLRDNWDKLRSIGHVVLFRRSALGIYESLIVRRRDIFEECPEAEQYDNWDVDVIVNKRGEEYSRAEAISNIERHISAREPYYSDNSDNRTNYDEVCTDDKEEALNTLKRIRATLD